VAQVESDNFARCPWGYSRRIFMQSLPSRNSTRSVPSQRVW